MEAPAVTLSRELDPEQRLQHALDLAFRYLTRRERTVLEMRRYLEGKRVEPDAIEPGARASRSARATWTTRASRGSSPRTSGCWRSGAPTASNDAC